MVSMISYPSIALCILFALLMQADQGNGMEGDRHTSINGQAKGASTQKEVSVAGEGKTIIGGRKMLVAKKDVFSPQVESTADYHSPKPRTPTRKHRMDIPGGADETDNTGGMNLINEDYRQFPPRKPPVHA